MFLGAVGQPPVVAAIGGFLFDVRLDARVQVFRHCDAHCDARCSNEARVWFFDGWEIPGVVDWVPPRPGAAHARGPGGRRNHTRGFRGNALGSRGFIDDGADVVGGYGDDGDNSVGE